jgi:hypothetical protein
LSRSVLVWAAFALWIGLFGGAFAAFQHIEPDGDGFFRGLNRVSAFLVWQLGAAVVALASLVLIRRDRKLAGFATRVVGYLPPAISGALFLIVIGFYVYAVVVARL